MRSGQWMLNPELILFAGPSERAGERASAFICMGNICMLRLGEGGRTPGSGLMTSPLLPQGMHAAGMHARSASAQQNWRGNIRTSGRHSTAARWRQGDGQAWRSWWASVCSGSPAPGGAQPRPGASGILAQKLQCVGCSKHVQTQTSRGRPRRARTSRRALLRSARRWPHLAWAPHPVDDPPAPTTAAQEVITFVTVLGRP